MCQSYGAAPGVHRPPFEVFLAIFLSVHYFVSCLQHSTRRRTRQTSCTNSGLWTSVRHRKFWLKFKAKLPESSRSHGGTNFLRMKKVLNWTRLTFLLAIFLEPCSACRKRKLCFVWTGPGRVVNVNTDTVFEVENPLSAKREVLHASRLKL